MNDPAAPAEESIASVSAGPDPANFDPAAAAIALAAATALNRYKANVLLVILACALAGLALRLVWETERR